MEAVATCSCWRPTNTNRDFRMGFFFLPPGRPWPCFYFACLSTAAAFKHLTGKTEGEVEALRRTAAANMKKATPHSPDKLLKGPPFWRSKATGWVPKRKNTPRKKKKPATLKTPGVGCARFWRVSANQLSAVTQFRMMWRISNSTFP